VSSIESLNAKIEKMISTVGKDNLRPKNPSFDKNKNIAELMVAVALMNRNRWDDSENSPVAKRIRAFVEAYPSIRSVEQLKQVLDKMDDKWEITCEILHMGGSGKPDEPYPGRTRHGKNQWLRTRMLVEIVDAFLKYKMDYNLNCSDAEVLKHWAENSNRSVENIPLRENVYGIGQKTVDWLRIFGAGMNQTAEDRWVIRGLFSLGLGDAVQTVEFISKITGLTPYQLDGLFIDYGKKMKKISKLED
jgi:hypothetical protein